MSPKPAVSISYFSDILCVWAYFAQIKLEQMRREFGAQVELRHDFISVFGDVEGKIEGGWKVPRSWRAGAEEMSSTPP